MTHSVEFRTIFETDGISGYVSMGIPFLYNYLIRSRLPKTGNSTTVSFNGVDVVSDQRRFDTIIPFAGDRPGYERSLIRGIEWGVSTDDRVVMVGGGYGVCATIAAKQVGTGGQVIVYEGSKKFVTKTCETVELNAVSDRVEVKHAIIGTIANLRGPPESPLQLFPTDLPDTDVLVLDCEGAEAEILSELSIHPTRVIVETHGELGATTASIIELLEANGFNILDILPAHVQPQSRDQKIVMAEAEP